MPGKGEGGLSALEFEAESVQARADAIRAALASGAAKGLLLGDEDVGRVVSGVVPGLEPLLGMLQLVAQLESGRLDRVVVDMAGTGHAPRCSTRRRSSAARSLARGEKPAEQEEGRRSGR